MSSQSKWLGGGGMQINAQSFRPTHRGKGKEAGVCRYTSVADPGFPRGKLQPVKGAPVYYFTNSSRKLHENVEILARDGGDASFVPLRSVTASIIRNWGELSQHFCVT